jgi:hypothetical protein
MPASGARKVMIEHGGDLGNIITPEFGLSGNEIEHQQNQTHFDDHSSCRLASWDGMRLVETLFRITCERRSTSSLTACATVKRGRDQD